MTLLLLVNGWDLYYLAEYDVTTTWQKMTLLQLEYSWPFRFLTKRDIYATWLKLTDLLPTYSVTRLGNLLDFGQLFKAFVNN